MRVNKIIAAAAAAAMITLSGCSGSDSLSGTSGSSGSSDPSGPPGTSDTSDTEPITAEEQAAKTEEPETIKSVLNSGVPEDTIVAKPGNGAKGAEGMEITFGEFLREYRYFLARNGYESDTDTAGAEFFASSRRGIIDAIIEDRIVRAKFEEYGMSLTDEDRQEIKSAVDYGIAQIKSGIMQSLAAADSTITPEQLAQQAEERFSRILADCGLTVDTLSGWQEGAQMKKRLTAEIGKDAVYSYEDAQAQLQSLIDSLRSQYESSPETYLGQTYANIWVPEGSRTVQAIMVGFDSETYLHIQQLRSGGDNAAADEYRAGKLKDIQERYDEIMEEIASGADFEQLMEDHSEGGGNGTFLVTPGTEVFGTEFAECAMGIESPGDVSSCVTDFGYYIVKYSEDASVSEDTLKESTEELRQYLLETEKSKLFSEEFGKWKTEYAFETEDNILGLSYS